jgi:hypothetical protein
MKRAHRKGPSGCAVIGILVFVAISFAISEVLNHPIILLATFGIPVVFWWGRQWEKGARDIKYAEHVGRKITPDFQTEYPSAPVWLGPDENVKPFPSVPGYREENSGPGQTTNPTKKQLLNDPLSGARPIWGSRDE